VVARLMRAVPRFMGAPAVATARWVDWPLWRFVRIIPAIALTTEGYCCSEIPVA